MGAEKRMKRAPYLLFWGCAVVGMLIQGCAHKKAAPAPVAQPLPEEIARKILPPDVMATQDLPPESAPAEGTTATPLESAPETQIPPTEQTRSFAVWIDGAGLEAFAALGFLQELEQHNMKPVKVVGTGFGCWIALSWALENSGNRAEWQAYKWSSWDPLPGGGLLSKLTPGSGRRSFEEEFRRLFPKNSFDELALAAECPLVPKRRPVSLISGRFLPLATNLWYQLQTPALGVTPSSGDYYSGLLAGTPLPAELEHFSREIAANKNFSGWIVLRTRTAEERAGSDVWAQWLTARADERDLPQGRLSEKNSWLVLDLAQGRRRQSSDILKFEKRREWLLEGRRAGQRLLEKSAGKPFF